MASERLQKLLAASGIASRRKAEEIIAAGRVTVNGRVVSELGSKADPATDKICVDGKPLEPAGRPTVMDLLGKLDARVYPVGRLDYSSEGLLLVTNDGDLAQKLTKAGDHMPKTYLVKISGRPGEESIERLRRGITIPLEDGRRVKTSPAQVRLIEDAANPWYEVILTEGRNRQIRRMFEAVGFQVEKIKRVQFGPLTLDVPRGKFRALSPREVAELKSLTQGSAGRGLKVVRPPAMRPS